MIEQTRDVHTQDLAGTGIVPFAVEISGRHSELPHGAWACRSWGKKHRQVVMSGSFLCGRHPSRHAERSEASAEGEASRAGRR
jgi:hypothetical protein